MSNQLWRRKDIAMLQAEGEAGSGLKRTLGMWGLTGIGLGAIIGVGIFVLTGIAAATEAGPAVALSFVIAAVASGCAALSYAEFASMIPVAGSAYTYSYAVLGELIAWIIGWDLLIEYALVVAVVAIGLAGYVNELAVSAGVHVPAWMAGAPSTGHGHVIDLFAVVICLFISWLLSRGIESGARFNSTIVIIKIAIVVGVIILGATFVDVSNLKPFMPFGFDGVMGGAALVFFAVFGYDAMSTAAEEARNPQRDVPRAIVLSLAIAMVLYVLMSLVLTGMVPYQSLNNAAPVAKAFADVGKPIVASIVSIGAIAGITSVLFAFMLAAARIWFALSRDGLLPAWFAALHPKHRTPHRPTWILGVVTALVAGLLPIADVAKLVNIGTLSAFILVCASIIILRRRKPQLKRGFRCPWVPVIPLLGIGFSFWLILSLEPVTWIRFAVWMAIGLVIYFAYGMRHSRLGRESA